MYRWQHGRLLSYPEGLLERRSWAIDEQRNSYRFREREQLTGGYVVSEYQYIAFRAVDRPLTDRELAFAGKQST